MNGARSTDKYQSLYDLQESLIKLFSVLEYHPEKAKLKLPTKFQRFIDQYANSGYDRDFVNDLRERIDEATKLADGKRLDIWSDKETIRECTEQIQIYEKLLSEKTEYIEQLKDELSRKAEAEESVSIIMPSETQPENDFKEAIAEIIALRDRQILKRDHLISIGEPDGSPSHRIIDSTLIETANMLRKWNVDMLDGLGKFSPYEQMAVDTKETDDECLVGTVAEVVRPGYRYRGEMLRAAEVIVYTKKA